MNLSAEDFQAIALTLQLASVTTVLLLLLATALRWFNQPAAPAAALVPAPTAVLTAPASAPASPVIAPAATAAMAPPTAAAGPTPVAPILRVVPLANLVAPKFQEFDGSGAAPAGCASTTSWACAGCG